jgi:hypothetical protein
MRRVADWRVPTLTKWIFTAGQQCPKLLWWKVHEPNAVELQPDIVLQDRFDQGAQVGALARDLFDGGTLIGHFVSRGEPIAKTKTADAGALNRSSKAPSALVILHRITRLTITAGTAP